MTTTDTRLPTWTWRAPRGVTKQFTFTETNGTEIPSLSVWVGGTLDDLDDFTGATQYTAAISGDDNEIATVSVPIPTDPTSVPLRLAVAGAPVTVGALIPSKEGTASSATDIPITLGSLSFALTVGNVVVSGGGAGISDGDKGDITVTGSGSTWTIDDGVVTAAKVAADVATQAELDAEIAARGDADTTLATAIDDEATARGAADTVLDGRLDTIEGDYLTSGDVGTAAAQDVDDFATGAEGDLASSATQPGDDADTLGSGAATDGQVLTADGAGNSAWETSPAGVTDHGALDGLTDDDHSLYALADGTRGDFATEAEGALAASAVQPGDTIPVTDGGTGSTTAGDARSALGLVIGTDVAAQSHADATDNPHSVTATQVGLGNVDNTADADKPVSTAQQTALDAKVAKSLFDANTLLTADTDDTPAALSVAASRIVGRKATGGIDDLTTAELAALFGTPTGSKFLADDGSLKTPAGGSSQADIPLVPFQATDFSIPGAIQVGAQQGVGHPNVAGTYYCFPFVIGQAITVAKVGAYVTSAAGTNCRVSVYSCSTWDGTLTRVADLGTFGTASTGAKTITGLSQVLPPGRYYLVYQTDDASQFQAYRHLATTTGIGPGLINDWYNGEPSKTGTYGAAPATLSGLSFSSSATGRGIISNACVFLNWTVN